MTVAGITHEEKNRREKEEHIILPLRGYSLLEEKGLYTNNCNTRNHVIIAVIKATALSGSNTGRCGLTTIDQGLPSMLEEINMNIMKIKQVQNVMLQKKYYGKDSFESEWVIIVLSLEG